MLIDSGHKKWFLATVLIAAAALALYGFMEWKTGRIMGGSTAGLWYAVAGALLMLFAASLSLLRKVPSWTWLGPRKVWLKGHIWLGLLSGIFLLCHSGFRWGGLLERILWIVLALTLLTGIYGLVLQQFLPRAITVRIPYEAPYEQIPHLCQVMRQKADSLMEAIETSLVKQSASSFSVQIQTQSVIQLREFYETQVRPFLHWPQPRSSPFSNRLQMETTFSKFRTLPGMAASEEQLTQLESFCEERRQLADQERLHLWLHGWLLVHIPLSVALLVLGATHALVALYY